MEIIQTDQFYEILLEIVHSFFSISFKKKKKKNDLNVEPAASIYLKGTYSRI